MPLMITGLARRAIVAWVLIGIASGLLVSRFALVHIVAQPVTKRSFENKILPQVPLKLQIRKRRRRKH